MLNRLTLTAAILATAIGSGAAIAQSSSSSSSMAPSPSSAPASSAAASSAADGQFLANAIQTDDEEIALGGIALARSTTTAVRDFGLMLIVDHRHSRIGAEAVAQKEGVRTPTDLSTDAVSELQKLMGLSGQAFDQEFASAMVAGHTQAIAAFEDEAKNKGKVAAFAERTLPTLRKHLKMAQELEAKANGSASSAPSAEPMSSASSAVAAPPSLEPPPSSEPMSSSSAM